MKRFTVTDCQSRKTEGQKLVMLTCYDATFARILDASGIEMILIGDSLGMVMQGHGDTLPVTLDDIIYHTRCVTRVARQALVIADLPFMSYQASPEMALLSAGRCLKEGRAQAVKLEGGEEQATTVRALVNAGIPVMGHIGLQPQHIHRMGGYKIQGKTGAAQKQLLKDALALEEAGVFSLVLEGILPDCARRITRSLAIPTVGIAAGPHCDGQVLVLQDLLGLDAEWRPKYVKRYLEGHALVGAAVRNFAQEVRGGKFPRGEEKLRMVR